MVVSQPPMWRGRPRPPEVAPASRRPERTQPRSGTRKKREARNSFQGTPSGTPLNDYVVGAELDQRPDHFLNRLSNAARASCGFNAAGVDVSFSTITRIAYDGHSFRTSFLATRSFTGCIHSNRLDGSKYVHCLHECNSNPHLGHAPSGSLRFCSTVPHCEQRDTLRVPGI